MKIFSLLRRIVNSTQTSERPIDLSFAESENLYRTLIENSLDAIVLTQDFRFSYFNRVFCKMLGYTKEELLEIDPIKIVAPEERERVMSYHQEHMSGESFSQNYSAVFLRKDGSRFIAELNATSVAANGKPASLITMRDVTQREQLAKALRESEQKYKTLVEHSLDSIMIIRDNKLFFANNSYCNMLGYTYEELQNMSAIAPIIEEDRIKAIKIAERRRALDFSTIHEDIRMKTKTGELRQCECTATVIEYEGYPASFLTLHDKTESNQMQQALQESEAQYRSLVEQALDGITITQDRKLVFVNQAFCNILEYSMEEMLNMPVEQAVSEQNKDEMNDLFRRLDAGERFTTYTTWDAVAKSGKIKNVELHSSVIDYKGRPAFLVITRDMTERIKMQQALLDSENKYKMLVENSQDGIIIVKEDIIRYANSTICKILGYTNEEILGCSVFDFVEPSFLEQGKALLKRRLDGELGSISMDFHFKDRCGQLIEAETMSSILEYNGENVAFFTIHDITERNRMQKALSKSERRFRELTEMLPQAVYELDVNNTPTFMNKTGREMFKMGDMKFEGKKAYDFFSVEDTAKMQEALKYEAENSDYSVGSYYVNSRAMEYTAKRTDGTTFPVLIYGAPIFENGIAVGSRGIIVDITDRKAAEEAMLESERKYRELADFMPQTLFELDKNLCLVYINKTGMEQFGLTAEEFGKFSPEYFVPEDLPKLKSNLEFLLDGKSSEVICEYTAVSKTGQHIPILTYSIPIYRNEEVVGIRGIILDISERKAVERALKESEEKYRMLVDDANDGIVLTQDGVLKLANKAMCNILEYDFDEFYDKPFYDFVHPDDRAVMIQYHQRRMTGEQFTILYRARLIRKTGEIITVELNARTLTYNNEPAAFIIIRDITERVAIENELKAAKEQLEKLNKNLETRVQESSQKLAETHMQLVNLQKENLQSQFDVLRQQVNPHFLFNSLNVLTSLIKIEPDLAEQFSEHLSKVYRYVLENKDNELVDLCTELRFLDAYIFLLNIRFVGKIKVNINIPNEMHSAQLIPLAMQLLIENAIKHNIMTKLNPLVIDVFIDENNYLNIINNLQERPSQIVSTGIGLKNIENRYLLLNLAKPIFEKSETHFTAKVPLVLKQWCWAEKC